MRHHSIDSHIASTNIAGCKERGGGATTTQIWAQPRQSCGRRGGLAAAHRRDANQPRLDWTEQGLPHRRPPWPLPSPPKSKRYSCHYKVLYYRRSKMEIIVIISLVVLLALGAFFIIPKSQKKGKAKETNSGANGLTSSSYTKEEISKHNTRKDCWIIIKDKVYDVTPYVEEHPGGDAILNNAGGDSTEGFFGPQHGTRVFDIIEDFCIGQLKAS